VSVWPPEGTYELLSTDPNATFTGLGAPRAVRLLDSAACGRVEQEWGRPIPGVAIPVDGKK
jgi:hypothetical protein